MEAAGHNAGVIECTTLGEGDTRFCAKVVIGDVIARSCAIGSVVQQMEAVGLNSDGCKEAGPLEICLCSTDACNTGNNIKASIVIFAIIFSFLFSKI